MGFSPDGAEKLKACIYYAPSPRARAVRQAVELTSKLSVDNLSVDDLDLIVDFVVTLFGNQFTADDVWDGLGADEIPKLTEIIGAVMTGTNERLEKIPNAAGEAAN